METAIDQDSEPADQPSAPSLSAPPQDGASSALSNSLERLSINSSTNGPSEPPKSPATAPVSPTQTRKPLIHRSNTHDNQRRSSSRRRSSGGLTAPTANQLTSPRLTRRSSGVFQPADTPTKASPRRSSSQTFSRKSSTAYVTSTSSIPESDSMPWTASSVASDYFKRELELHKTSEYNRPDTIIILHDSCYGHRFSRRKTSKSNLSLIVERPERIKAGILGLSSAYVRLGDRHAAGQHQPHPHRSPPLNLPFLISKSTRSTPLTSSAVTNVHGTKWMHDLTTMCNSAQAKLAAGAKELARPDTPSTASKPKLHEGDLYLCQESLDALQGALGGVLDAVDAVFGYTYSSPEPTPLYKKAFVCVRPPGHHCSADMPSGFCWLNNVHVGIEHAALSHGLTHAAIIDFDLHHGDGSQTITWDRNAKAARVPKNSPISKKTSIGYFSLHDINSYPCEWGDIEKVQSASLCIENAHNQTIWNVHLQPWKTESEFWELYNTRYLVLLEKARAYLKAQTSRIRSTSTTVKPKAAIFISAGFDASEWEGQGMQRHNVNVPTEFYARFTADILKLAQEDGTSVEGRVISVLEGGYSDRALMSGVMSHISGLVGPTNSPTYGLDSADLPNGSGVRNVDKEWWSAAALSELEAALLPAPTLPPSRKIRSSDLSTFATPTQSFTAKVVDPSKVYRSLSGAAPPPPEPPRAPTPPPPEVEWAIAASELSKLLIPTDRRVDSYRHEELAEPRVKKERYSSIDLPTTQQLPGKQPQTRGRKAKAPAYAEPTSTMDKNGLPVRKSSNSRRRTLSDLPTVPDDPAPESTASTHGFLERPTTADSKAHSEGSVAGWATFPATSSSAGDEYQAELRPGKTRRQSGILADIQRLNEIPSESHPTGNTEKDVETPSLGNVSAPDNTSSQQAAPETAKPTDVDSLTSGVKKITLRMNPKTTEEQKPGPVKKAAPKAPRKSTAPRAPKTTGTGAAGAKTTSARSTKSAKAAAAASTIPETRNEQIPELPHSVIPQFLHLPSSPAENQHSVSNLEPGTTSYPQVAETAHEEANQVSLQTQNVPDLSNGAVLISANSIENSTESHNLHQETAELLTENATNFDPPDSGMEFVPYQPSHGSSKFTSVKPDALTWLPPNTNTPTGTPIAKRGKENLPVFSATGPIPFAIPQSSGFGTNPAAMTEESGLSTANGNLSTAPGEQTKPKMEDDSIWEVSSSPPHRA